MKRRTLRRFESLEPRLAMAGLVTFPDVDGDTVTIRSSRGTDAELNAALTLVPSGSMGGSQLQRINLVGPQFAGTILSVTARPSAFGGNGRVNVGEIYSNRDLRSVTVGGDLGKIKSGDTNPATPGISSLIAGSIGTFQTATGAFDNRSVINGSLPFLKLDGDLTGASIMVVGRAANIVIGGSIYGINDSDGLVAESIGSIQVLGSIFGGSTFASGRVQTTRGGIGQLRIGGDLSGGLGGDDAGQVVSAGPIGLARIGGFVTGSSGMRSGSLSAGGTGITRLVVGGGILGGSMDFTGNVTTSGSIGTVRIGGSIQGGGGAWSGRLAATRGIGTLDVVGSIQGGVGVYSGSVSGDSGRIGTVRVQSILAGDGPLSGTLSAFALGNVLVRGDIAGSLLEFAYVTGVGSASPTGPRAIGSLTVRGTVSRANVLGGYALSVPLNNAARIGAVTVGSMAASNIVAGAENFVLPGTFGNAGDAPIGNVPGRSRIESLVVVGIGTGSFVPTDSYGVVANSIGRVRINGTGYTVRRGVGVNPDGGNLLIHLV